MRFLHGRRRCVLMALGLVACVLVVATEMGTVVAVRAAMLPSAGAVSDQGLPEDTLIYDRSGQVVLADLHPSGYQRYHASLQDMGTWLPRATVATEDANFWSEGGVDPLAILRAALANVRQGRVVEGGSTITQQLVKLRVTGGQGSLARKLREAIIAVQVSGAYSREQILAMYLNTIPYGNGAYGAQAAARVYFHTDAARLTPGQAAMLAGLPQSPNANDPLAHWDTARARQRHVLDALVRARSMTAAQADQAYAEDLRPPQHMFGPQTVALAPQFTGWVKDDLVRRYGARAVQEGGLRVTTTLDWGLQQAAQRSVSDAVGANRWRDVSDGALTAVDPRSGQVLAMVGSAGAEVPGGQIDMSTSPRNPGSTFKLFTYTAAIASRKYTMVTPLRDAQLTVKLSGETYKPQNDDGRFHGTCQLQECLGNSLNIPAVQVEMAVGVPAVVEQARAMGAPPFAPASGSYSDQVPASSFGPSLTLGGYPETALRMAVAAGVLAGQGVLRDPSGLLKVAFPDGRRQAWPAASARQAVDPGAAFIVSQMLSDDANRRMIFGPGSPLVLPGRHAAAKTGTSEHFTDGWTVGYTPSLAAAVWMGNADGHPMRANVDGIAVAAPAWHSFMEAALGAMGKGDEWYRPPAGVHQETVRGRAAWFLDGTSAATPAAALPSNVQLAPETPQITLPTSLQELWNALFPPGGGPPWGWGGGD
jgi:membrane peptidoglycan carboxypeptidase